MNTFQWFGISGGEAIVRHYFQGHVYRFKPSRDDGWSSPELSRVEAGKIAWKQPEEFTAVARDAVRSHLLSWQVAA